MESGVANIADALKAGVRATAQAAEDAADAAEDTAQDVRAESEPRVGARPLNVTYSSGAGKTFQDTSTSGGSQAAASASATAGTHHLLRTASCTSMGRTGLTW